MKVVIAMDSFKGSISSFDASEVIADGIREVYHDAEIVPLSLADGGEGTVCALVESTGGQYVKTFVTGPLGERITAKYGILGNEQTAVIEVAAACGLPLLTKDERNPLEATTYGVGEMIIHAMEKGCRDFIIGLGGSATNDAGVGMLQALGYSFLDKNNQEVGFGGGVLKGIEQMKTEAAHPLLPECTFTLASDVNNYLYGREGAAYVFARQKGASKVVTTELDDGLKHFASVVKKELGKDIHRISGAGAAGGLGAAFVGFLEADCQSGISLIADRIGVRTYMKNADFVITGEGELDDQSMLGKVPVGIAKLAREQNIPVIALAGSIKGDQTKLNEHGITSMFSILATPMSTKEAMEKTRTLQQLHITTVQLFRLISSLRQADRSKRNLDV